MTRHLAFKLNHDAESLRGVAFFRGVTDFDASVRQIRQSEGAPLATNSDQDPNQISGLLNLEYAMNGWNSEEPITLVRQGAKRKSTPTVL